MEYTIQLTCDEKVYVALQQAADELEISVSEYAEEILQRWAIGDAVDREWEIG